MPAAPSATPAQIKDAREKLDAQVRDVVRWHFSPDTGTPFWLERAKSFKFNPLKDVQGFDDLKLFGFFEDDWLRGAPGLDIRRWVPRGFKDKPVYVFETGGTCFCIDLDPRWVVKLIKKGWMEHLKAYQEHCIDQAMTILSAGHQITCMFTTPKLLDALCKKLEEQGSSIAKSGITGIFCGGTEMTSQWIRFTIEEYIAPTYGNTLMGLATADMPTAESGYKITYYAPQPRAVAQVVEFQDYDRVV